MRRSRLILAVATLAVSMLALSSTVFLSGAQDQSACQALVTEAFTQLAESCAGAPGSSACFGSAASATLLDGADGSFSEAGDMLDLSNVQSIQTLALDESGEHWGLAMLNVHANVPLALSEQGLKFVLLGDVQIDNLVDPAAAFTPVESVTVTPLVAANLRSAPSTEARVIGNAPVGTELLADGLSGDGGWLRVLNGGETAWISRQVVNAPNGDLDGLPTIGSDTRTLMQAITLRTGAEATCDGAPPSMLVIQAPEGLTARIQVNGVDIQFTSTLALRVLPDVGMQIISLGGGANTGVVSIPAGFLVNVPMNGDGTPSGAATGLRPITEGERGLLSLAANGLIDGMMHDPLSVPSQEDVAAVLAGLNAASGSGQVVGGGADCSRFRATSPLDGLAFGLTPFYWDPAPGATGYRINIFGEDGGLRFSIDASTASSTFTVDTGAQIGEGSFFSWNVEALVNGSVACRSGQVSLPRAVGGQGVGTGGGGQPQPTDPPWGGP